MSVEDSESRRLELKIRLSFCQAALGPKSAQDFFFSFFFLKNRFGEDLCSHEV